MVGQTRATSYESDSDFHISPSGLKVPYVQTKPAKSVSTPIEKPIPVVKEMEGNQNKKKKYIAISKFQFSILSLCILFISVGNLICMFVMVYILTRPKESTTISRTIETVDAPLIRRVEEFLTNWTLSRTSPAD
jgi:hypothetical protein